MFRDQKFQVAFKIKKNEFLMYEKGSSSTFVQVQVFVQSYQKLSSSLMV